MRLAYVRWRDACQDPNDDRQPIPEDPLQELHEIGWLLQETDEVVSIGMELYVRDETPGRFKLHIPKLNILELRIIDFDKLPKRKRKR